MMGLLDGVPALFALGGLVWAVLMAIAVLRVLWHLGSWLRDK